MIVKNIFTIPQLRHIGDDYKATISVQISIPISNFFLCCLEVLLCCYELRSEMNQTNLQALLDARDQAGTKLPCLCQPVSLVVESCNGHTENSTDKAEQSYTQFLEISFHMPRSRIVINKNS